jgi:hypothetical protein
VAEAYSFENSDGFLQRLNFVYPDVSCRHTKPTASDFESKEAGFSKANQIFQLLAEVEFPLQSSSSNGDKFFTLSFHKDAQKIVDDWLEKSNRKPSQFKQEMRRMLPIYTSYPKPALLLS